MSFCELTDEELQAVRKHHDMLIEMGRLELRAEQIRETCPNDAQQQMLKPIEVQMQELDDVIMHLAA